MTDLAQEDPKYQESDNVLCTPGELVADAQNWLIKFIQAANDRIDHLAEELDHHSVADCQEPARAISHAFISHLLGQTLADMGGDGHYTGGPTNSDAMLTLWGGTGPLHTLVGNLRLGPPQMEKHGDEIKVAANAPQLQGNAAIVDEESGDDAVLGEAHTEPIRSGESFAFAVTGDASIASASIDVLNPAAATNELDLVESTPVQLLGIGPVMDFDTGGSVALQNLGYESPTCSSFVSADDFIV
jgi:hypothetical protein